MNPEKHGIVESFVARRFDRDDDGPEIPFGDLWVLYLEFERQNAFRIGSCETQHRFRRALLAEGFTITQTGSTTTCTGFKPKELACLRTWREEK